MFPGLFSFSHQITKCISIIPEYTMALPNFIVQLGEQAIRGPSVNPTLYTEKVKLDASGIASRRVFAFELRGLGDIKTAQISEMFRSARP